MSFRDDHDAALARIHALEAEQARDQREDESRETRMSALEAELADERRKLERAEAELARLRPEPPPEPPPVLPVTADPPAVAKPLRKLAIGAAIGAVGLGLAIWLVTRDGGSEPAAAPPVKPSVKPPSPPALPDQVSGFLDAALERAGRVIPGGRLVEIEGEGIDEQGGLHRAYGLVTFTFARSNPEPVWAPDPSRPIGAPVPAPPTSSPHSCAHLEHSFGGWEGGDYEKYPYLIDHCGDQYAKRPALVPKCTMRAIWTKALADDAPRGAIAKISLTGGSWTFQIYDARVRFRRTYADDCTPPTAADLGAPW